MNTSPVCPRRYITSDRKGNKFLIDGSGLQKEYILKKVNQRSTIEIVAEGNRFRITVKFRNISNYG